MCLEHLIHNDPNSKYMNLENRQRIQNDVYCEKGFHSLSFSNSGNSGKASGWKLHINTDKKHVPKVYEIVYPLLKYYKLPFKVATQKKLNEKQNNPRELRRHIDYAQFTIYLQENGKTRIEIGKLHSLLNKLNTQLSNNKVPASKKANSDAATKFAHFSLRNDCVDIPFKLRSKLFIEAISRKKRKYNKSYIHSSLVGKAYNPANLVNPFKSILQLYKTSNISSNTRTLNIENSHLKQLGDSPLNIHNKYLHPLGRVKPYNPLTLNFNPAEHFNAFEVRGKNNRFDDKLIVAVTCTLWIVSREYYLKKNNSSRDKNRAFHKIAYTEIGKCYINRNWMLKKEFSFYMIKNIPELAYRMLSDINQMKKFNPDIFVRAIEATKNIKKSVNNKFPLKLDKLKELNKNFLKFLEKALDIC